MADDPDMMAAELALGLLEGEARAAALERLLRDRAFAAEVEDWRLRLAQLFDLWPEAAAPDDLIDRIDASLDGHAAPRARRAPWPLLAMVSTAITASLLVVIALRPGAPPAPQPAPVVASAEDTPALVAGIAAGERSVGALYRPAGGTLRIARAAAVAPAGRVAELWVIGTDGSGPYPLGLLGEGVTTIRLSPADRARLAAGATLAISIEPPGGSPTGKPTGPVVGTGALSAV